jgi:hypothetical protein
MEQKSQGILEKQTSDESVLIKHLAVQEVECCL